jgi:hypothetical protein
MDTKQQKLWAEMASLTMEKCKQHCHALGSCCDPLYCDEARRYAQQQGIVLKEIGNEIPFLTAGGVCVVPPYLRPICTVHQCKIASLGLDPKDPKWTKRYFQLREQLNELVELP